MVVIWCFGRKLIFERYLFGFNLVSGCRISGEMLLAHFFLFVLTMVTDGLLASWRILAFGKARSISFCSFVRSTFP